ncbi:hypothetical protein AOLI_G00225260 [Acnodon oligacanthus]
MNRLKKCQQLYPAASLEKNTVGVHSTKDNSPTRNPPRSPAHLADQVEEEKEEEVEGGGAVNCCFALPNYTSEQVLQGKHWKHEREKPAISRAHSPQG